MQTRFDRKRAQRAVDFFEKLLVHTKGEYARQPFRLSDFQRKDIVEPLFGRLVKDPDSGAWVRRYRLAWLEVARKNGKSELMAGIALLLTGGDDEEGAEVYGVARDTDQASLVFNVAKRMLELAKLGGPPRSGLPFTIYPTNKRIVYAKTGSYYRVIAADDLGNLGQDPHGIIFDEVIAQKDGALWDALKTGFGSRRQPLMIAATTAGDDPGSFAKVEHDFSMKVTEDPDLDPRRFVFIRAAPREMDWTSEEAAKAANPAYGEFLRPQVLKDDLQEALSNPRAERAYKQFRLNQWQDSPSQEWIGLPEWEATAGIVDEAKLDHRPCYIGLVAASALDLTAMALTFPPQDDEVWQVTWRYFLPEEALSALSKRTNGDAERWATDERSGLRVTEGNEIDIQVHIEQIRADLGAFDVREVAWDAHGIIGITQQLISEFGAKRFVAIAPNTPGSALKDWETLIRKRLYHHSMNPIALWMLGHLQVREGQSGILRIDRKNSADDVSGIYAAELAMRRALLTMKPRSVYEDRGILTVG